MTKKKQLSGKIADTKQKPLVNVSDSKVVSAISAPIAPDFSTKNSPTGKSVSSVKSTLKNNVSNAKNTSTTGSNKMSRLKKSASILDNSINTEDYFMYLNNPLEYRRHLLESSRKILFCLKSYQTIILIRQRKLEEIKILKINLKELSYMIRKFKEKLPKYNPAFLEATTGVVSKKAINSSPMAEKPVVNAAPVPSPAKTELERLEESLANIERRLKNL